MLTITHTSALFDSKAGALILAVTKDDVKNGLSKKHIDTLTTLWGDHTTIFDAHGFKGATGSLVFHVGLTAKGKAIPVVCVGVGDLDKSSDDNKEALRRALGSAYTALKKSKPKRVNVVLPDANHFGCSYSELVEQMATLFHIASYSFMGARGAEAQKEKQWQPAIVFAGKKADLDQAISVGTIIGEAMNMTRSFADTPPNILTPQVLADHAKSVAKEYKLSCKVFDQEKAKKLGMGCYYSVAKGSVNTGQFAILEYSSKKKGAPTVALVGKGVCFDTGGISLKPANYMTGMKYDMSGAAAVIGAMRAIAQLKPDVNVVGITPLVENMPSAYASKQDDVVTAMNGMTVEIDNTDAEGRLILADALCYAEKHYKPEAMIDIATLTGACMHALGHFYAGLFTRSDVMAENLTSIGKHVGDKLWRLPMTDEYKPALKSDVADISNCGTPTYKAGATTAALFLENFVGKDTKWAHLDIAGTDSKIPGTTYYGRGATGTSLRVLVEFVMQYAKK